METYFSNVTIFEKSHGLSLSRYIFDEHYVKRCKTLLYSETCDGVADTISALLTNYNYNSKMLIKQLLSSYQLTQLTVLQHNQSLFSYIV